MHKLKQLAVGIAAAGCVFFMIGVFRNQIRLATIGLQCLLRLSGDIATERPIRSSPNSSRRSRVIRGERVCSFLLPPNYLVPIVYSARETLNNAVIVAY